jgi:N-acetylmuramoyl-L-alanine amidase
MSKKWSAKKVRTRSNSVHGFVILFIFAKVSPLFSQASAGQALLPLNITFPSQIDTFRLDYIRISGNTDPGAVVSVNGQRVSVYPTGAFVHRLPLVTGQNYISIRAEKNSQLVRQVLYIYRPESLVATPKSPLRIDDEMMMPKEDVWLLPGDYLQVRLKSSPDARAYFSIDDQEKNVPMVELEPNFTGGLAGVYSGQVRIKPAITNRPYHIKFEVRNEDGEKARSTAPGALYVLPEHIPIVGRINKFTQVSNHLEQGASLGFLQDSVRVHVIGRLGSGFKIRLGNNRTGFISIDDVDLLPWGTPLPMTSVSSPAISVNKDWYVLAMDVQMPVPVFSRQDVTGPVVELELFGAYQGSQWTTFPANPIDIERIYWQQEESDVLRIGVQMANKQPWGYKIEYRGNKLLLGIRKSPAIASPPQSPVKDLTIVIDPGHGGAEDTGAVSPLGIFEKDVNLSWAKFLAEQLRVAGARVRLTRSDDRAVSLADRMNIAVNENAHLFISLHNNAVGPDGDPARARGVAVFYNTPQSKELAWAIYPYMVNLGLEPRGRSFTSFFVNRNTAMPSVLVEGAFITSPDDEQLLMNNVFLQKMAKAVFAGIEDYLRQSLVFKNG